jgi:flagellar hook-basal body complex protein FliE
MTSPITPIRPPVQIDPIGGTKPAGGAGFASVMKDAMSTGNNIQTGANATVEAFLNGEGGELHQVALAQQQASISFDLFMQVRNKVVTAYQEVMRMQL